ncbi:tRNA (guanosine(46)-N7)-methyltransferase TrmB [Paenibacillus sp. CGMCC 1.16610]|uniref:tRNA (guanine-N(7)-)-methyltransferase n=1 Tax=Paenibacillus anseongense TaxID=2682845 RepID=A0ABW9U324_9BACL|nr:MULTISPECIES: tRNA (guanosine(46)-N7)-methyltransferase TrmB [Paenibacillus]MBA2943427.1 tRNA (guanosine(46)-N7)-methyltransferase TrmB [Paenibacillus sp. CGMCC 1.16610]MVQ33926.1 tRNA (guanosine(46)-N7)-methyltransferase TrmB [Paenibacillus anseongense]
MRLRGRKGIREDIERQKELVVLNAKDYKGKWAELFGNNNPIHAELGMGKGRFISEMSKKYPDVNFIGVDMYDELIRKASEKAKIAHEINTEEESESVTNIPNLKLMLFNIEHIEEAFAEGELERVYLNFSDPWPKKKHARRRLTHPGFVAKYQQILNGNGEIHLKTDSQSLFEFSLNSFADMGLRMRNISLNLHAEGFHPDHVMTEYETKFATKGMNIHRCEVVIGQDVLAAHLDQLNKAKAE